MPESERRARSAEDSCIECHMPARPTVDVQHTSQTDHRVLKNPTLTSPSAPAEADKGQFQLVRDGEAIPDWETERARAILMSRVAVELSDSALAVLAGESLESLVSRGLKDSVTEHALGEVYLLQNRLELAEIHFHTALKLNPQNEAALRSLAVALHTAGRNTEAVTYLAEFMEHNHWDRVIQGRYVHALGRLNRTPEAAELAKACVEKFPYDIQIRQWLAAYCSALGMDEQAAEHRKIADRLSR
ncbi:MAG: tetratricopeptide repeat protein [Planctomycetaceae bacterium]